MDGDRCGSSHHGQGGCDARVPGRGFQGDQTAHRVAHQMGSPVTGCYHQARHPVGVPLDRAERGSLRPSVAGKIDGQDRETVVGEVAGLELPRGLVKTGAVQEHHQRLPAIHRTTAGRGGNGGAVDRKPHASYLLEARRAAARSPIRSVGVLQPDREADQVLAHSGPLQLSGVHGGMGGGGRVDDQGFRVTHVGEMGKNLQAFDEPSNGLPGRPRSRKRRSLRTRRASIVPPDHGRDGRAVPDS